MVFWNCQILLEDNVCVTPKLMVLWIYHKILYGTYDTQIIFYDYFFTGGRDFFIFGKNERLGNQKGWGRKRNWLLVPFPACPTGVTKCFSIPIGYQFIVVITINVISLKLVTITNFKGLRTVLFAAVSFQIFISAYISNTFTLFTYTFLNIIQMQIVLSNHCG